MGPEIYAAARRAAALRLPGGCAPRAAAITAEEAISNRQTLHAAGYGWANATLLRSYRGVDW